MRDGKHCEGFALNLSGQLEIKSDHLEYLLFRSFRKERDMHDGTCREGRASGKEEEVLSCALKSAEYLIALCSLQAACKVGKLV